MNENMLTILSLALFLVGSEAMIGFAWLGYLNLLVIIIPAYLTIFGMGFIYPNCTAGALLPFAHMASTAGHC
jgi:DHA1 family 2-module integral membrane pump EmrD-like MFS transporter